MQPTQRQPTIGVCGASVCDIGVAAQAEEVGRRIAEAGAMLVCGGRGGVMEAACRGARAAGGITIGLLPGTKKEEANPAVQIALPTGMGQARNVLVVQASDVVIAIGGIYGTLSEIALALKLGRQVIGLHTWDLGRNPWGQPHILAAQTPTEAVELALQNLLHGP